MQEQSPSNFFLCVQNKFQVKQSTEKLGARRGARVDNAHCLPCEIWAAFCRHNSVDSRLFTRGCPQDSCCPKQNSATLCKKTEVPLHVRCCLQASLNAFGSLHPTTRDHPTSRTHAKSHMITIFAFQAPPNRDQLLCLLITLRNRGDWPKILTSRNLNVVCYWFTVPKNTVTV
jgi:hypothetical protein